MNLDDSKLAQLLFVMKAKPNDSSLISDLFQAALEYVTVLFFKLNMF